MLANDSFHIAVIAGDGIGHEVMAPALDVLRKAAAATPDLRLRFTAAPATRRASSSRARTHPIDAPDRGVP
jgi:isocitrate/isopropylmalate dehydrogenase